MYYRRPWEEVDDGTLSELLKGRRRVGRFNNQSRAKGALGSAASRGFHLSMRYDLKSFCPFRTVVPSISPSLGFLFLRANVSFLLGEIPSVMTRFIDPFRGLNALMCVASRGCHPSKHYGWKPAFPVESWGQLHSPTVAIFGLLAAADCVALPSSRLPSPISSNSSFGRF